MDLKGEIYSLQIKLEHRSAHHLLEGVQSFQA